MVVYSFKNAETFLFVCYHSTFAHRSRNDNLDSVAS